MPNRTLVLVAAAVAEARDQPSTYSSRRPGRQVPASVDQVVSFTIATDDVCLPGTAGLAYLADRFVLQILLNRPQW